MRRYFLTLRAAPILGEVIVGEVIVGKQPLFLDTDEDAERVLIELARATPDWKKFEEVAAMIKLCRMLATAGLRDRYPHATDEEIKRRLAALVLDREIVKLVYGWDPEIEGY